MSRQGRHGESLFSTLCQDPAAETDAVVNKAADDEHGWDHVVDLSPQRDVSTPADLQDHLIQCFAQIKTTRGKCPRTQVKLSNAIKSAKSPNPSFIFLFHHESHTDQPTLYGKHIWREAINQFLKRGRKASIEDPEKALYDLKLSIPFNEDDKILGHPSDWMLRKINENGGGSYSSNKLNLVKSVGYDGFCHEAKFSIPATTSTEDIILHELGLVKDLPISDFLIFDNRFGMTAQIPHPAIKEGRIEFSSEGQPVLLKFISSKMHEFDVSAQIHVPHLIPYDHNEYRIRVDAGCINIISHPKEKTQTFNYKIDLESEGQFDQKIGLLSFLSWSQNMPVTFELHCDEGRLFSGQANSSPAVEAWMHQHATVGRHIYQLLGGEKAKSLRISHKDFASCVDDMFLAATLSDAGVFRLQGDFAPDLDEFSHLIGYSFTQINGWCVGALYQLECKKREKTDDRTNIYFRFPKIVKSLAFKKPKADFEALIQHEFNEFRRGLSTPTMMIFDGDLTRWSKAMNAGSNIAIDIS